MTTEKEIAAIKKLRFFRAAKVTYEGLEFQAWSARVGKGLGGVYFVEMMLYDAMWGLVTPPPEQRWAKVGFSTSPAEAQSLCARLNAMEEEE